MSKVLIIGGHGKVALRLARLLVRRGDEVTSIVRNPAHGPEVTATGARTVVSDVEGLSIAQLTDLVRGQDAVVWSAGAGGGSPVRTYAVDRDAAIRSMEAAKAAGVDRYVMVSYLRVRPDHQVSPDDSFFPYLDSKLAADEHLRGSGLAYTILHPDLLTLDQPTGKIDILTTVPEQQTTVSRDDVAAVAAAVLADDTTTGRTIGFRTGDTAIAEAIRG